MAGRRTLERTMWVSGTAEMVDFVGGRMAMNCPSV
jgi:hypothetical protein